MAKRKQGVIVGTVDSDSDHEIEIDLSATMNIQEHSAHISHKRFFSSSVLQKTTMPIHSVTATPSMSPIQSSPIAQSPLAGQTTFKQTQLSKDM
jgi:hypothetical protein